MSITEIHKTVAPLTGPTNPGPDVDVVIPVYNEAKDLSACVTRLHAYLSARSPYSFRITIADNASKDETLAIARDLERRFSTVRVVHLDEKGRGRALNAVWSASDARVVAYMDVDLSTDLESFVPLVMPLMSGESDLAIGSRLKRGSHVVRSAKREFISRCYNFILRRSLNVHFSDAQCGFKALRTDCARVLLPQIQDTNWFFDTELLVLAERSRMRLHEVSVNWFEDPDSSVDIAATALEDLRGVMRLRHTAPLLATTPTATKETLQCR